MEGLSETDRMIVIWRLDMAKTVFLKQQLERWKDRQDSMAFPRRHLLTCID